MVVVGNQCVRGRLLGVGWIYRSLVADYWWKVEYEASGGVQYTPLTHSLFKGQYTIYIVHKDIFIYNIYII